MIEADLVFSPYAKKGSLEELFKHFVFLDITRKFIENILSENTSLVRTIVILNLLKTYNGIVTLADISLCGETKMLLSLLPYKVNFKQKKCDEKY